MQDKEISIARIMGISDFATKKKISELSFIEEGVLTFDGDTFVASIPYVLTIVCLPNSVNLQMDYELDDTVALACSIPYGQFNFSKESKESPWKFESGFQIREINGRETDFQITQEELTKEPYLQHFSDVIVKKLTEKNEQISQSQHELLSLYEANIKLLRETEIASIQSHLGEIIEATR